MLRLTAFFLRYSPGPPERCFSPKRRRTGSPQFLLPLTEVQVPRQLAREVEKEKLQCASWVAGANGQTAVSRQDERDQVPSASHQ